MSLAIIFTGQGTQNQDMFLKFNECYSSTDLEYISNKLNINLTPQIQLAREQLIQNKYAQPLIAAHGLLVYQKIIKEINPNIIALSGYSLGEITAIAASTNLSLPEIIDITIKRAQLMTTTLESGLMYINGLSISQLQSYISQYDLYIAIINGDTQIIIGGNVQKLNQFAKEELIKIPNYQSHKLLDVKVASHTPLLQNAGVYYKDYLLENNIITKNLNYKIVSGYNSLTSYTTTNAINNASLQMYNTIDFNRVIHVLYELGAEVILELGQGSALQSIIKNTNLPIKVRSLDDFKNIDQVTNWLNKIIQI